MTPLSFQNVQRFLGSLPMAVGLLLAIAAILGWATFYEARYGTAAVQHHVYTSLWFQGLLGFLAINLFLAAMARFPWKRRHAPFVAAHLGIILLLLGGIVSGRYGIDGQLVIPEGGVERVMLQSRKLLTVVEPNPGVRHAWPTAFEAAAWRQAPAWRRELPLQEGTLRVRVDQYLPDAKKVETVTGDGPVEHPAVRLRLVHDGGEQSLWLFSRDPERSGALWGDLHVLFLEPAPEEMAAWRTVAAPGRGAVTVQLPGWDAPLTLPVPETLGGSIPLPASPYTLTFKDYFSDFAVTESGIANLSEAARNPAVAVLLDGPEGADAHLLFARDPDFARSHGLTSKIAATLTYRHPAVGVLPPDAVGIIRRPDGALEAWLTGPDGERQTLAPLEAGQAHTHPWSGAAFTLEQSLERGVRREAYEARGPAVKEEALHLVAEDGTRTAEAWLQLESEVSLPLGHDRVVLGYRRDRRELPFAVKLLDFRKIDYPGTEMAAGFESDVELMDTQHGVILLRTIKMNQPLRYRGYSLYQASFVPGTPEVTVLAVRNDPGTPLVYAGCAIILLGVIGMFVLRPVKLG